jgi:hypothetical protein
MTDSAMTAGTAETYQESMGTLEMARLLNGVVRLAFHAGFGETAMPEAHAFSEFPAFCGSEVTTAIAGV